MTKNKQTSLHIKSRAIKYAKSKKEWLEIKVEINDQPTQKK